jgi:hypothetical protein
VVDQKRSHRVTARSTRVRIRGREAAVVNLSLGGACLEVDLAPGPPLSLTLRHPHLLEQADLRADVVWAADGKAGLRFHEPAEEQRLLLRRCMLAEHGHGVWTGREAARPVGYIVATKPGEWGLFDPQVRRVAGLRKVDVGLLLSREGAPAEVAPGFAEAAARAFELARAPWLDPPLVLERPAPLGPAQPRLTGSVVLHERKVVGYVARTGASWSFFDPQREPLGFMTLQPGGAWKVVVLGSNDDGSLDLRAAPSYPEALAAAFALRAPPELTSTTFEPAALLEL